MQQEQALQNPHFKKIWEEVIINRHPSEETLIDALLIEADYDGCLFIQDGYIGMPQVFSNDCGYAYAFNFCSDYQYENNRKISFFDDEERKKYDVNTGVLLEEYTEEVLNKERVLQHILGRPITLENILMLLGKNTRQRNEIGIIMLENGNLYIKPQTGGGGKYDFEWEYSKPLDEQSDDTWEKIYEIINKK